MISSRPSPSYFWRWLLWAFLITAWTVLLVIPEPEPPSGPLGDFLTGRKFIIAKTVHVSMYGILAILGAWLHVPARYRWLIVWFLMAHAGITEFVQLNWSDREGCLRDVVLNYAGISVGIAISWKWWTEAAFGSPNGANCDSPGQRPR